MHNTQWINWTKNRLTTVSDTEQTDDCEWYRTDWQPWVIQNTAVSDTEQSDDCEWYRMWLWVIQNRLTTVSDTEHDCEWYRTDCWQLWVIQNRLLTTVSDMIQQHEVQQVNITLHEVKCARLWQHTTASPRKSTNEHTHTCTCTYS